MNSSPSTESDAVDLWRKDEFMYGSMQLSGYRVIAGKNPKFVRANKDMPNLFENLYKLMTEVWNFSKPELIISLNGGAKNMIPLNNDQQLAFKRGLIDVSKSAPTWIVTGGFEAGVSKLVGDASKDYSILSKKQSFTVLGIGTWGSTYNNKRLIMNSEDDKVIYHNDDIQKVKKGQSQLNPHHDAFILYDDGTDKKFGGEIEFRAQFEKFASDTAKCSVIQLIVEGGKNTIYTGAKALDSGIPVVVMKGSKRAADVICDVVEATDTMLDDTISLKCSEFASEWSIKTKEDENNFRENLQTFARCYKNKDKMVHLFNMRDFKNNLDTAIIEAAFSGTIDKEKLEDDAKLKLAMTFNRADVAEERIFGDKTDIKLREYMKPALMRNQWQFVDFFLRQGITVESFLTKKLLHDLYFDKEANSHLNTAVTFIFQGYMNSKKKQNLKTVGKIINQLTDNIFPAMYSENEPNSCSCCCWNNAKVIDTQLSTDTLTGCEVNDYEKYIEPQVIIESNKCCRRKRDSNNNNNNNNNNNSNNDDNSIKYTIHPTRNKDNHIIYTEQDLFLWALLTQRIEMAKIFWKCGKDHIGSALVASIICNSLQKKAGSKGEIEIQNNWKKFQEDFETMSIDILSEAYRRDQIRTHLLLIRGLPYWGRESCLDIANKNQMINFLFHSACQTRLNSIWLGKIPNVVNNFQILVNIPFGFLTSRIFIFPYNLLGQKKVDSTNEKSILEEQSDSNKFQTPDNEFSMYKQTSSDNFIQNDYQKEYVKSKNRKKNKRSQEDLKRTEYLTKFRKELHFSMDNISFCSAIKYFYTAPVTKFVMNIISYLSFLTIFSYLLLIELNTVALSPNSINRATEYTVYVYFISFVIGEIRQFFMGGQANNLASKFNNWKSSMWNWFDLLTYIVFTVGYVLRCSGDSYIIYCRTLFAMSLSMFFIRFMEFYYVQKSVGPKVIMISRMLKDIGFFLAIYLIALFAYGTFSMSLLYPNINTTSLLMRNIIYNPYWQLFGQVDVSYMEGSQTLFGYTATPNAMVIVANAIFLLFSNVLLLSLLIAMFGVTFTKVEENSNRVWAFTRYRMIEEFYYRPILPPPFNIFEVFFHCFELMCCRKNNNGRLSIDAFIANLTHEEDLECSGFEQQCMETYLMSKSLFESSSNDSSKTAFKSDNASNDDQSNATVESHIKSLVAVISDMKNDMKTLNERVYKIRRLQKKNIISKTNEII